MTNAKEELLKHIQDRKVKYVCVIRKNACNNRETIEGALDEVLPKLDFCYDNYRGDREFGEELEGAIWYSDGTWSDRESYDGTELWMHRVCPPLPSNALDDARLAPAVRRL